MWLLDVHTFELHEFVGENIPPYAILSHTWGPEEVTFVEIKKPKHRNDAQRKAGFEKIRQFCAVAGRDKFNWAWVDTCCIDKRSSAELSEAINSMYRWYMCSGFCYIYLEDVPSGGEAVRCLPGSKWFTRGWTLQELLAPKNLSFFAKDWAVIGSYAGGPGIDLAEEVSKITGIPREFLTGQQRLSQASAAQRIFWASRRQTTRPEDRAYSLMGLFDINMPVLYGEGLANAFRRLQLEFLKHSPDLSIFAWLPRSGDRNIELLASSPDVYQNSGNVIHLKADHSEYLPSSSFMTNLGFRVTLPVLMLYRQVPILRLCDSAVAVLNCAIKGGDGSLRRIGLRIRFYCTSLDGNRVFFCSRGSSFDLCERFEKGRSCQTETLVILRGSRF